MMRQAEPGHGRPVWVPGRGSRAVASLRSALQGQVYEPGDDGYDQVRQTWKQRVDQRPALVARAWGLADVRTAVGWAGEHRLPVAVQSTGHGTHVAADGALLIKTSDLAGVLIDPGRRIARVGPGTRWSQVIEAAAPFGLVPLSGSSADVGVAGYTLGGGLGWLSRRYGFAADSLLRASVVTADAGLVTASRDSHPDLFWALRGGGGNFGIATSLEFRLYPVTSVYAGIAYFPLARAADTLARYREWSAGEPDELTTAVVLLSNPPEGMRGPVLAIRALYTGPAAAARRALRPLWDAAGPPIRDTMREMAFADTRGIPSAGSRNFQMAAELPDPLIADLVAAARQPATEAAGQPVTVEVRHWGGAIADAGRDAGPAGHRDAPFSLILDGSSETLASIRAYPAGRSFLNFLHDADRTETAYPPASYRQLRDLKRAWDPDNVFGTTHNIPPATGHGVPAAAEPLAVGR
jgi:FAD/FMN-containing dehydrogenase